MSHNLNIITINISMKTIVVKINGKWQLIKVEAGRIFTGEDHNMKAIKYFDKKVKENNDN